MFLQRFLFPDTSPGRLIVGAVCKPGIFCWNIFLYFFVGKKSKQEENPYIFSSCSTQALFIIAGSQIFSEVSDPHIWSWMFVELLCLIVEK